MYEAKCSLSDHVRKRCFTTAIAYAEPNVLTHGSAEPKSRRLTSTGERIAAEAAWHWKYEHGAHRAILLTPLAREPRTILAPALYRDDVCGEPLRSDRFTTWSRPIFRLENVEYLIMGGETSRGHQTCRSGIVPMFGAHTWCMKPRLLAPRAGRRFDASC